jgi:acetoin utilization deacetylase AcuC-like enzyme
MILTAIIAHPNYMRHLTGHGHPESPARYSTIEKALKEAGLLTATTLVTPRAASREDLLLCHTPDYVDLVYREVHNLTEDDGSMMLSTGDVQICSASWDVALLAVGGVLTVIDVVMTKRANIAFAAVSPPGHHATQSKGMGFCTFNNVAIGARYAKKKYGIERDLIVDWDVHHGNGIEEIFLHDPTVFYFSTHQSPLYPFTGLTSHKHILNCPIPAGSCGMVVESFKSKLLPAMKSFSPQLVLISAGFDAHRLDPLGNLGLSDSDFEELTQIVKGVANTYAEGKVVSALEGGYSLEALASAIPRHVTALGS